MLRDFHDAIGFDEVNENLYDNSGNIIKDYECRKISEKIASLTDDEIKKEMVEILLRNPFTDDATKADPSEEADAWVGLVREWQEFLAQCADLKGCEVL
jgi:hypothetical protein